MQATSNTTAKDSTPPTVSNTGRYMEVDFPGFSASSVGVISSLLGVLKVESVGVIGVVERESVGVIGVVECESVGVIGVVECESVWCSRV
jgi:hypothetical protein